MAERPPQPPIPSGTLTADLCIQTTHRMLRSRLYYHLATPPTTESQLTQIADQIKTFFTPQLPALLPNIHYFSRVECRYYGASNSLIFANSSAAAGPGLISVPQSNDEDGGDESEDVLPDDVALIIQKKTGKRGRANQGRLFIGGIAEKINFAGEVAENLVATAKTLAGKIPQTITITGTDIAGDANARHWNRKENQMVPLTRCYVVKVMGSRMDRRPKVLYERL